MPSNSPHIVLIDGPSGTGKSTLAATMGRALTATVVHLDDVYPGWEGLAAGRDAVIEEVLEPIARGESGTLKLWDWATDAPGEVRVIEPPMVLVIEGCGISTARSRALAHTTVWLDCEKTIREARIDRRDPAAFVPFRDVWAEQVERHIAENDPIRSATIRLNG